MNRKFMNGTAMVFVTALLLGTAGCMAEAPDVVAADVVDDGLAVDAEGVIHFDDKDAFFGTLDRVGTMSPAELDAWEDRIGLVSYRREFERVMALAMNAGSEAEADAILAANDDIVEVSEDEANPRIRASGYAAVVNRAGLFYVEGTIHKVLPDVVLSSEDGRLETIEKTMDSMNPLSMALLDRMATPAEGVRIVRYEGSRLEHQEVVPYGCTDYKSAFYNTSDRKVDFDIWTWPYYCAGCCGDYYYQVKVQARLRGYKKNFWGNWTDNYSTSYEYESLEFQVTAPHGITGNNNSYWVFDYQPYIISSSYGASGGDYQTWNFGSWNVGNQVMNSPINAPYFDKVKGRGKSRGTGAGGWAEICCGYAGGCSFGPACVPRSSCYAGECGYVSNNCGGTLYCGSCGGGGGGCVPNDSKSGDDIILCEPD